MHGLNWIDYLIITVMLLSVLISLVRGFVREFLSLIAWIAAIWVALTFGGDLADPLSDYVNHSALRIGLAYFILFLATLVIFALINFLIIQLVAKIGLKSFDKILGAGFGVARGIILISLMLAFANLTGMPKQKYWQEASLLPYFNPIQQWMLNYIPLNIGTKLAELSPPKGEQNGKIVLVENK